MDGWASRPADERFTNHRLIGHALFHPSPFDYRYMVANVDGVPAWVLGWVVHICPDRFADFVVKQFS